MNRRVDGRLDNTQRQIISERQTNRRKRSGATLQPVAHHVSDSVPPEVELSQSVEASQVGHTRDLIPSQVEHSEVTEVGQVFDISDLWGEEERRMEGGKERGRDGGREGGSKEGGGREQVRKTDYLTMLPCKSRTSRRTSVLRPVILRIL